MSGLSLGSDEGDELGFLRSSWSVLWWLSQEDLFCLLGPSSLYTIPSFGSLYLKSPGGCFVKLWSTHGSGTVTSVSKVSWKPWVYSCRFLIVYRLLSGDRSFSNVFVCLLSLGLCYLPLLLNFYSLMWVLCSCIVKNFTHKFLVFSWESLIVIFVTLFFKLCSDFL